MPKNDKPKISRILYDLQRDETLKRQAAPEGELDPQLALLRQWQAARLRRTYADLLEDERYAPACRFFLSDIYAAKDFSQRDHDLERVYHLMQRFVPQHMLQLLADSIELNRLSNQLDQDLLQVLIEDLGLADTLTPELYAEGYRKCDNYADRERQIELIEEVVHKVGEGSKNPLVGATLRLARKPAEKAGWFELYDFLNRGYAAFKQIRSGATFAETIGQRERLILEQIYAGAAEPFEV